MPDTAFRRDQTDIADGFVEGHYLHVRRRHVSLPVRVWYGPPADLEGDGELDRGWRWQVSIAGVVLDDERAGTAVATLEEIWPRCLDQRVDAAETAYRQARVEHARQHDFADPFGHPTGRIDLFTATLPF